MLEAILLNFDLEFVRYNSRLLKQSHQELVETLAREHELTPFARTNSIHRLSS